MKLHSLMILLICSPAYPAGPTDPKAPQKILLSTPFFHRKACVYKGSGLSWTKKTISGCARIALFLPSCNSLDRSSRLKKILSFFSKGVTSLKVEGDDPPPPFFFKEIGRLQRLRHLSLSGRLLSKKEPLDLSHLHLKSLKITKSCSPPLPLSLALENLTLEEEHFYPGPRLAKKLRKAAFRLRNLKNLSYDAFEESGLDDKTLSAILSSLKQGLDRRGPSRRKLDSLKLYLQHINFELFKNFFEKGRVLKHLSLHGYLSLFDLEPSPSKLKRQTNALFILLRNLESLSLTDYESLPRLFQGAEKLEDLAIQHLIFKEEDTEEVFTTPEDVKGMISAFQLKSLETLTLDSEAALVDPSTLLSQILAEENISEIESIQELHFHTLNINISSEHYDNGLRHFLEAVFTKAPLKTFSFSSRGYLGSCREHEEWVFGNLLQRYKSEKPPKAFEKFEALELRGFFHRKILQKLFENKDGQGALGNPNLKKLCFVDGATDEDSPRSLRELLSWFSPEDVQKEASFLPEKEAIDVFRKALNLPDRLEISFTP